MSESHLNTQYGSELSMDRSKADVESLGLKDKEGSLSELESDWKIQNEAGRFGSHGDSREATEIENGEKQSESPESRRFGSWNRDGEWDSTIIGGTMVVVALTLLGAVLGTRNWDHRDTSTTNTTTYNVSPETTPSH